MRPTARGVVLVLVGVLLGFAAYGEQQAALLVPAALCVAVVALGACWAVGAVGRVQVSVPAVVEEWADALLRVSADPKHAGAGWSTWAPGPERYLLLQGVLDEHGRAEVGLGGQPRGRWPLAPVDVVVLDPFRVVRITRRLEPATSLVVGPELLDVPQAALRSNREAGAQTRASTADSVDAMVRPWQPGDPQRRVHWRQTAKRGQLMVRQEADPSSDDDLVVIETALAAALDRDAEDRLARAACSLVRALALGDRPVRVRETGEPSLPGTDWRDRGAALAAFSCFEARSSTHPLPGGGAAHVVALEEAAPEPWSLAPGTTLWLVAPRDAAPRGAPQGSRVRLARWLDGVGPVRELR